MSEEPDVEAYYVADGDTIRLSYGHLLQGQYRNLDIKDAVFLRYQLDGAIRDYERSVQGS